LERARGRVNIHAVPDPSLPSVAPFLEEARALVDGYLEEALPRRDGPPRLAEAMRYSVFAGGKRLRPALAIAAARAVGGDNECVLPFAAALELVHTYSLIHDDLPAMDDDDAGGRRATARSGRRSRSSRATRSTRSPSRSCWAA
jgi:geranylgeranyl pyrophosphate synthase